MLNIIILVAFILPLVIGTGLMLAKKMINLGKAIITVTVAAGLGIIAFFAAIIIAMSKANSNFYIIMLIIAWAFCVTLTVCSLWGMIKKKSVRISFLSAAIVYLLVFSSYQGYNIYIDSIPTIEENSGLLAEYEPYAEDTKTVTLDEEVELKITEDIPRLDGATAMYPIYASFAKAVYPKEAIDHSGKTMNYLTCTKTDGAYESIVLGGADIIFVGAPSKEQEQFARDNGVELQYTPIGKEGFVFFVNAQNPIEDITVEQIQQIYSGEITKWSELDVEGIGSIKAFQRDEGSGSQSALERLMAGKTLMTPPKRDVINGMGGIIQRAADYRNFKNALGFSFRFYSTEMVKNNEIKLLSINGIYPSEENIRNGKYPIASNFYAVTRSDASENTRKLVQWIQGAQGQKIIEMTGYTPIG